MATRVGMKPIKEPVPTPAPATAPAEETILPEITHELEKALKVTKRGRTKKTK